MSTALEKYLTQSMILFGEKLTGCLFEARLSRPVTPVLQGTHVEGYRMRCQMLDNLLGLLDDQFHRFIPRCAFELSILSDLLCVYSSLAEVRFQLPKRTGLTGKVSRSG